MEMVVSRRGQVLVVVVVVVLVGRGHRSRGRDSRRQRVCGLLQGVRGVSGRGAGAPDTAGIVVVIVIDVVVGGGSSGDGGGCGSGRGGGCGGSDGGGKHMVYREWVMVPVRLQH